MLDKLCRFVNTLDMTSAVVDGSLAAWRDHRKPYWLLALIVPVLPFAAAGLAAATGWTLAWWLGPALVFGAMPAHDLVLGRDRENPPESAVPALEADRYYRR